MSKLFIAVPIYDSVGPAFLQSMLTLMSKPPVSFVYRHNAGDALLSRSRNSLAAEFLKTDCDKLLFIDSDIEFTPSDVEKIASHTKPIVSGVCCKRKPGKPEWCTCALQERKVEIGEIVEVKYVGTGFVAISREVFEKLKGSVASYRSVHFKDAKGNRELHHDFFSPAIVGDDYIGEDYSFCNRWRLAGGTCWLDTGVQLKHWGPVAFPLNT